MVEKKKRRHEWEINREYRDEIERRDKENTKKDYGKGRQEKYYERTTLTRPLSILKVETPSNIYRYSHTHSNSQILTQTQGPSSKIIQHIKKRIREMGM